MFKKVAASLNDSELESRSNQLRELSKHVSEGIRATGMREDGDNCRTICEERLVVVNGKLKREIVCHTVCNV